jgi:hypothetical protein
VTAGPANRGSIPPTTELPPPYGNHRDAVAGGPVEHVDDVLLVARERDEIGHVVEAAVQVAHHVAERLAVGVPGPGDRIRGAQVGERGGWAHPRRRESELGRVRRRMVGEVVAGQEGGGPLDQRLGLGAGDGVLGVAPAPPRAAHQHPRRRLTSG